MDDPQVGWERAVGPVAAGLLTAAVLTIAGGIAAGLALGPHTVSGNFVVARDPGFRSRLEIALQPINALTALLVLLAVAILRLTRSDTKWRTLRHPSAGVAWLLVAAGVYGIYDAYTPPEGYQLDDWQKFLLAGPRAAMLVVATLTVWLATRTPQTDRDRTPADDRPVAIEMQ